MHNHSHNIAYMSVLLVDFSNHYLFTASVALHFEINNVTLHQV